MFYVYVMDIEISNELNIVDNIVIEYHEDQIPLVFMWSMML